MNNIACFKDDCNNSVRGQCSGYKGNCGRFFCSEHSQNALCGVCATKKGDEEETIRQERELQRTLDRYTTIAEEIGPRPAIFSIVQMTLIFEVILFLILMAFGPSAGDSMSIFALMCFPSTIISVIISIFIYRSNRKTVEKKVSEATKNNPIFDEVYEYWNQYKGQQNKEDLKRALIGTAIFTGKLGVGMAKEAHRQGKRDGLY